MIECQDADPGGPESLFNRMRMPHTAMKKSFILIGLWLVMLLGPLAIFTYYEVWPNGAQKGWHSATLDRNGYLYKWTDNRLKVWAMLYVTGAGLLWIGQRRDPDGQKVAHLMGSGTGKAMAPFIAGLTLMLISFLPAAEVVIVLMLVGILFYAIWILSRSGTSLARTTGELMLCMTTVAIVLGVGEAVMRLPAVVRKTGGRWSVCPALQRDDQIAEGRPKPTSKPSPGRTQAQGHDVHRCRG